MNEEEEEDKSIILPDSDAQGTHGTKLSQPDTPYLVVISTNFRDEDDFVVKPSKEEEEKKEENPEEDEPEANPDPKLDPDPETESIPQQEPEIIKLDDEHAATDPPTKKSTKRKRKKSKRKLRKVVTQPSRLRPVDPHEQITKIVQEKMKLQKISDQQKMKQQEAQHQLARREYEQQLRVQQVQIQRAQKCFELHVKSEEKAKIIAEQKKQQDLEREKRAALSMSRLQQAQERHEALLYQKSEDIVKKQAERWLKQRFAEQTQRQRMRQKDYYLEIQRKKEREREQKIEQQRLARLEAEQTRKSALAAIGIDYGHFSL